MSNPSFSRLKVDALQIWVDFCGRAADLEPQSTMLFGVINRARTSDNLKHSMMALQAIDMLVEDHGVQGSEPNTIPQHLVDTYTHAMLKRRMYK